MPLAELGELLGKLVLVLSDPSLHAGVPMVLNRVVSATLENIGDVGPLVAQRCVCLEHPCILLRRPVPLADAWVQVVVPALSALLADSLRQILRDHRPFLSADPLHKLDQNHVLLGGPWSLASLASDSVLIVLDLVLVCSVRSLESWQFWLIEPPAVLFGL